MPITRNAKILVKRGYGNPGTNLEQGEPGFDLSTNTLYVGTNLGSQAVQIASYSDISTLINDISSNTYDYLKEPSLGSDFYWNGGLLEVSTGFGGVTIEYVDGSLAARDLSINELINYNAIQDASIAAFEANDVTYEYVDGSLALRDASITNLYETKTDLTYVDTSLNVKADITYIDSSLLLRDASLTDLYNIKLNGVGGTGTYRQVAYWVGTKELDNDTNFIWDPTNNRLGIGVTGFTTDDEERLLVDSGTTSETTVARFKSLVDNFTQLEVRNYSGGPNASADIVASGNWGGEDNGYIDLGINSENYNTDYIGTAKDAYLYSVAANLIIVNASMGNDIIFVTGDNDGDVYNNQRLRITTDGSILIGDPTSTNNLLEVNGDVNLPTGSNYKINEVPLYSNTYIDGSLNSKLSADAVGPLSTLQVARSTDFTVTTTWTDITFNFIDVSSNLDVLSLDAVNTERVNIGADGYYYFTSKVIPTSATSQRYDIRLQKNGTDIILGSESFVDIYSGESHELTISCVAYLNDGDYITLQGLAEVGGTFQNESDLNVTKLDGIKGLDGIDGQPGPAGSGSTINVAEEGSTLAGPFDEINFIGSSVTATADGSTANITIVGTVYGTEYQIASSTAVSSTTATTPQTKVTLTTTNLPSGNYKVTTHWMSQHSSASTSAYFDLTLGGTPQGVTTTISKEYKDTTDWVSMSRSYFLTLSGTNTFALRYWNESNSTDISDAHIELIRVS